MCRAVAGVPDVGAPQLRPPHAPPGRHPKTSWPGSGARTGAARSGLWTARGRCWCCPGCSHHPTLRGEGQVREEQGLRQGRTRGRAGKGVLNHFAILGLTVVSV